MITKTKNIMTLLPVVNLPKMSAKHKQDHGENYFLSSLEKEPSFFHLEPVKKKMISRISKLNQTLKQPSFSLPPSHTNLKSIS